MLYLNLKNLVCDLGLNLKYTFLENGMYSDVPSVNFYCHGKAFSARRLFCSPQINMFCSESSADARSCASANM